MDSFDFDSLSQHAREETLAFFRPNLEPDRIDDEFTSYTSMLEDVVGENDWLQEPQGRIVIPDDRKKMIPCDWEGCQAALSESELTDHLRGHGEDAFQQFEPRSSCNWAGCSSKATFKTEAVYRRHLINIHVEPLICRVRNCAYKRPFRNQADLDRHAASIHSDVRNYECPYPTCQSEPKTFARKDKWLKHILETIHEKDAICPYYHCAVKQEGTRGFETRREISKHFSNTHASIAGEGFECALDFCTEALSDSNWNQQGLIFHLRQDHGIRRIWWSNELLEIETNGRVVTAEYMDRHSGFLERYNACSTCSNVRTE